jgi:predicted N-acetyltransferase YhbS
MKNLIVNNIFEFWSHIGSIANKLIQTEDYSVIYMNDSVWPSRIFGLKNDTNTIESIIKLSQNKSLPDKLVIHNSIDLSKNSNIQFLNKHKNMALNLESYTDEPDVCKNITQVETERDSIAIANIVSESFKTVVAPELIPKIFANSKNTRCYVYKENLEYLGCGMIFFDSNNNAGLYLIGTLTKARKRGIGNCMTKHLIMEAKRENKKNCVLFASALGEKIYDRLGFKTFGYIDIYRILEK